MWTIERPSRSSASARSNTARMPEACSSANRMPRHVAEHQVLGIALEAGADELLHVASADEVDLAAPHGSGPRLPAGARVAVQAHEVRVVARLVERADVVEDLRLAGHA